MSTIVARLAGPLQSYGEQTRFSARGTLPFPTYSALTGLACAALGLGRDADLEAIGWVRSLSMAIRVDKVGTLVVDYQTINPPEATAYTWLSSTDKRRLQHTVPTGSGGIWRVPSGVSPMETWRTYLADAAFVWFVEGERDQIIRLRQALEEPHWQLSLGRKTCLPDWPLLLGVTNLSMLEAAREVPTVGVPGSRKVHILTGEGPSDAQMIMCASDPLGSHPHHGYGLRERQVTETSPPVLATRRELLAWAKENLR